MPAGYIDREGAEIELREVAVLVGDAGVRVDWVG